MATRTVHVRLVGDVNQYTRSMRRAADQTSRLAGISAKVGAGMVAAFAVAAAAAAKFDKELSNVRAVTGATGAEMEKLRAAALEAGKTTSFTATEAARAEAELARAGISTADIVGGALKGSLALAAAGQVDLTEAAVVSAQAMNTFGLKGRDVTHIADLLAAGANKSAADVHGLAMSLRMGGLLAHQTGLSIEDTVGTLAAFADHALIGSDAGTSLKVMLQRLVPQSKEARNMMESIGFSAYDATGKFVGLTELASRMKTSFSKLTPEARNAAMATIFGADAVRSATILYELGAEGINEYVSAVDDQGAAQRMASTQTDNLVGDLERLRGAIEVALIESGSAANDSLRAMTQWITRLVNAYNDLPPGVQHALTLFTGFGGAAALVTAGILLLIPRIHATTAALSAMGLTAARTRTIMATLGKVGIIVAGLELISLASQAVADQFKDAPPSVSKMASGLVDLGKNGKVSGEALKSLGGDLDLFGEAVKRVAHPDWKARTTDIVNSLTFGITEGMGEAQIPLEEAHDKIDAVDQALAQLAQSGNAQLAADAFNRLAGAAAADGTSTEKLLTLMPGYTDVLATLDVQGKTTAGTQEELAEQLGLTADQLQDQRTEAEKLADALSILNGINISGAQREIAFQKSLDDLTESVKDNGHSLDVTSEKGRAVKSAFLDAAQAAMEHAQAVSEQKGTQEAGQKVLEKDITLLKKRMSALGFSKDAIEELIGTYAQMPVTVATDVKVDTQKALTGLESLQGKIKDTKGKTVTVDALTDEARAHLASLGFQIKNTKGKKVSITVPTGSQQSAVQALAAAIAALRDKAVTITTSYVIKGSPNVPGGTYYGSTAGRSAHGNIYGPVQRYASGGMRENHVAQIAQPTWRIWGEPETGGEAYVPLSPAKRGRSVQILREVAKRFGYSLEHFASGGLLGGGFTYSPSGQAVLGGTSDPMTRYKGEVEDLKKAWADLNAAVKEQKKAATALKDAERNLSKVRKGHHTAAQLRAAEEKVTKAERAKRDADTKVRRERKDVAAANRELGLKAGGKPLTSFNLKAYETQLTESLGATEKWRKSLAKVGQRGGKELQAMLEAMGEEGYELVNALAGASDKQFKSIVSKLEKTGELAKATLADFTKQLGSSTKESQQFAADLQVLAAQGFGDLAQVLAAQGDAAAMTLAHEAAGNAKSAAAANKAVGSAQGTLTGEDLANALTLLSTLRGGTGRGFADLIAAGLDVATIRALVPKMTRQIAGLPEANKSTFVRQWVQQGGTAMAAGGILTGPSLVLGGEAGVPEAWIPWNRSARSRALLAKSAAALGYQLVPAGRYGGGGASTAAVAREVTKHIEVNLYGAKQSTEEQAHDIARRMAFVG
ncbi:phage tail tape measure protein [Streptomyces antibioticus]|uniref:phage tail tape measure protein n=1 Tax=Streptomyces antibioticus TaxID=1890 RepID=UPI003F44C8C2